MIEAGLEKLVEKFVREFTKDVCSLVSQNERMVLNFNHYVIRYYFTNTASKCTNGHKL